MQRENALEDPLVARGRQLGRQLASALEAQRAKRATPTVVSVLCPVRGRHVGSGKAGQAS